MTQALGPLSALLETKDRSLDSWARDRIYIYRAFLILGMMTLPLYGFLLEEPTTWKGANVLLGMRLSITGLLGALLLGSYFSAAVRKRFVSLSWGMLFLVMVWTMALVILDRFSGGRSVAMLFVYTLFGGIVGLGARSITPVVWFLGAGVLLTTGGLVLTPDPGTNPGILIGSMAIVALFEVVAARWALSAQKRLRARQSGLREQRRKIEALYEATRHLLQAESKETVSRRICEVLREVFRFDLGHVGLVDSRPAQGGKEKRSVIVPQETVTNGDASLPELTPKPLAEDLVATRALSRGKAVVVEDPETLENDVDYEPLSVLAGVPIGEKGAIVVGKETGSFDQLGLHLLEVLGGYGALVIDRLEREETLIEAKEEAEQAARAKSAFLASMSHEIRTPLTSVIGFAEAIGREVANDSAASGQATEGDQFTGGEGTTGGDHVMASGDGAAGRAASGSVARFAGLIEDSGQRLLDTLDAVLNFSKLEAGQMTLESEPTNLAGQARQVVEEMRAEAEDEGLELRTDLEDAWASADEGGVQIVLQNLLSNAIKYTEEGGVEVRTCQEEEQAILEVEDTGIGMDPAVAEDLFEPFRQASEGRNRQYEGSGIGLAVTQRAVEEMEGSIEVETQKGIGSKFRARFPQPATSVDSSAQG